MNVAALVPAYQAARTLPVLLPQLLERFSRDAILVVDDGSQDGTAEAARSFGVEVLVHGANAGKGTALMTGAQRARERGFTHVLTLDADGQHAPDCVPAFLEKAMDASVGVVVGARTLATPEMPLARVCSNRLTTALLGLQAGTALFDSQCGYRLYHLEAMLHPSIPRTGRFEWESEMLVRVARLGWTIDRVPIPTIYDDEAGSHIRPWRDTSRFVAMWFRLWTEIVKSPTGLRS
ncbi:MAG: Undecaprenyl-phosphate 4-deoxy-4-formamido-L-arabinose transferase [Fibrobacterota bacterium]